MRRTLASLLLLLVTVAIALPVVEAGFSRVPACCRRSGQHHCTAGVTGNGIGRAANTCSYHRLGAVVPPQAVAAPPISGVLLLNAASHKPALTESRPPALSPFGDAQKRAPPVS
jgi:hypothetical protein